MPALDLLFADGRGGSLADRRPVDTDTGFSSGVFGKLCTFARHGAAVAVKELKTGALDAARYALQGFFHPRLTCPGAVIEILVVAAR